MSISEFAKQLPDDKTTITIGYEKADGQFESYFLILNKYDKIESLEK